MSDIRELFSSLELIGIDISLDSLNAIKIQLLVFTKCYEIAIDSFIEIFTNSPISFQEISKANNINTIIENIFDIIDSPIKVDIIIDHIVIPFLISCIGPNYLSFKDIILKVI